MQRLSIITLLTGSLLVLSSCASDGGLAGKTKPINKEQTRLALCEGAQKIDIAFQALIAGAPGVIPVNVVSSEAAFVDMVGFGVNSAEPARPGSLCAKVYSGDLDVAINTAIISITNVSRLIKEWQH